VVVVRADQMGLLHGSAREMGLLHGSAREMVH
jgi:hypothetical protein